MIKKSDKKVIVVFGYWVKNLGDDLFLLSLINYLGQSPYRVVISCERQYAGYYRKLGVDILNDASIFCKICNKLQLEPLVLYAANKIFVMLGGSLFAEDIKKYDDKKIRNLRLGVKLSKRSMVMGSNFGGYKSKKFKTEYERIFSNADLVSFRDKYSCVEFKKNDNVKYAPDVVLAGYWDDKRTVGSNDKYVGISVIDFSVRQGLKEYTSLYEKYIAGLIELHQKKGDKVVLFSFCDKEGDINACKRIKRLCHSEVSIISYKNIASFLEVFKKCGKIYGTRFHSVILSMYYGIDCVPFIYNEKISNALDSYLGKGMYDAIYPEELKKLTSVDLINKKCLPLLDEEMQLRSRKHFDRLEKIISFI